MRRQEEIIWLRVQGFGRVISLLPSPHNLAAYEEEGLAWAHYPLERSGDPRPVLAACYQDIDESLAAGRASSCTKTSWATGSWGSWPAISSGPSASQPAAGGGARRARRRARHGGAGPRAALAELEGMPARTGRRAVSDRIEIRDLRVTGVHGVLPEEQARAQPFAVDIVAWLDMTAAQESDELADTVDYGALATGGGRRGRRPFLPPARGPGRAAGQRVAGQRRPPRGGRGHRAQAPAAAGARRGLDRGQGARRAR